MTSLGGFVCRVGIRGPWPHITYCQFWGLFLDEHFPGRLGILPSTCVYSSLAIEIGDISSSLFRRKLSLWEPSKWLRYSHGDPDLTPKPLLLKRTTIPCPLWMHLVWGNYSPLVIGLPYFWWIGCAVAWLTHTVLLTLSFSTLTLVLFKRLWGCAWGLSQAKEPPGSWYHAVGYLLCVKVNPLYSSKSLTTWIPGITFQW